MLSVNLITYSGKTKMNSLIARIQMIFVDKLLFLRERIEKILVIERSGPYPRRVLFVDI